MLTFAHDTQSNPALKFPSAPNDVLNVSHIRLEIALFCVSQSCSATTPAYFTHSSNYRPESRAIKSSVVLNWTKANTLNNAGSRDRRLKF